MTTIANKAQDLVFGSGIIVWSPMANGDDGQPAGMPGAGDRTVVVQGTFGAGGSVSIEGTLDADMTVWYPLHDPGLSLLTFTAAGLRAILENVVAVRPRVTAGDGTTAITVKMLTRRSQNG